MKKEDIETIIENALSEYSYGSFFGDWSLKKIYEMTGLSEGEMFNPDRSRDFVLRHAVTDEEYESIWVPRSHAVFKDLEYPSEKSFREGYDIFKYIGGVLFLRREWSLFTKCLKSIGETQFIIVSDQECMLGSSVQLVFDVETEWEEIVQGGVVAALLFNPLFAVYHLWGLSQSWGLSTDVDAYNPWVYVASPHEHRKCFYEYSEACRLKST